MNTVFLILFKNSFACATCHTTECVNFPIFHINYPQFWKMLKVWDDDMKYFWKVWVHYFWSSLTWTYSTRKSMTDPIPKRMIILLGLNCGKRWGTKGIFMALQKSRPVLNTVNFSDRLLLLEHILSQMTVMLFVSLCSFQTSFSMCELLGNDVSEKRSSR